MKGWLNMTEKTINQIICDQVVNDYFTPNIKAEVILDTLLTPYVGQMLKNECGINASFLTKEMSVPEGHTYGSAAPKIDYVFVGQEAAYLVELKTTDSSMDNGQAENYLNQCQGKLFGEKLGQQLLFILDKAETFTIHLEDKDIWGASCTWNDETLKKVFRTIMNKRFQVPCDVAGNGCAERAKNLIRNNSWTQRDKYRSRKYLYTLGQLVDYLNRDNGKNSLWNKPMEVIYLTPYGRDIVVGEKTCPSISLRMAGKNLRPQPGEEEYITLLQSIIEQIYGVEEK